MIHPSGIETSDHERYEPTKLQIANAARRANGYHRATQKAFPWWALFIVGIAIYGLYWMITN